MRIQLATGSDLTPATGVWLAALTEARGGFGRGFESRPSCLLKCLQFSREAIYCRTMVQTASVTATIGSEDIAVYAAPLSDLLRETTGIAPVAAGRT